MKRKLPTFEEVLNYNEEIIVEQQKERKQAEKHYNEVRPIMQVLTAIALIIIALAAVNSLSAGFAWLMVFLLLYAIIGGIFPTLIGANYDDEEVKKDIIINVLECFGTEIEYLPDSCIPLQAIKTGGMHVKDYRTTVKGKNYFRGYYNTSFFQFSYVNIHSSSVKELGGRGNYLIVNSNESSEQEVVIMRDRLEKNIGYLAHNIQNLVSDGNLVKLESADFEKKFVVYSKDQIGARYILSTTMMEKILKLDEEYEYGVNVSFVNGNMHVDIKGATPFFEYTFNLSDKIEMLYDKVYDEIYGLFELIDALDNKIQWRKK